ncbi:MULTISPECIES: PAS domain-containing protein, partial [unclassified Sphingomonas]|uniref:PAS domain-containing protein n=1 Tax=unclassified Sphingomonas TaxID=196159 RepID=UPI000AD7FCB9
MLGIVAQSSQHDLANVPGVGSYLWHVADDVLEWSPGLIALYGLSSPPLDEAGFYSLVHPEDRLRVEAETTAFLEHCHHYSHEFDLPPAEWPRDYDSLDHE